MEEYYFILASKSKPICFLPTVLIWLMWKVRNCIFHGFNSWACKCAISLSLLPEIDSNMQSVARLEFIIKLVLHISEISFPVINAYYFLLFQQRSEMITTTHTVYFLKIDSSPSFISNQSNMIYSFYFLEVLWSNTPGFMLLNVQWSLDHLHRTPPLSTKKHIFQSIIVWEWEVIPFFLWPIFSTAIQFA